MYQEGYQPDCELYIVIDYMKLYEYVIYTDDDLKLLFPQKPNHAVSLHHYYVTYGNDVTTSYKFVDKICVRRFTSTLPSEIQGKVLSFSKMPSYGEVCSLVDKIITGNLEDGDAKPEVVWLYL